MKICTRAFIYQHESSNRLDAVNEYGYGVWGKIAITYYTLNVLIGESIVSVKEQF